MEKDNLHERFSAYFSGDLSDSEKKILEEKIKENKDWNNQFILAKDIWDKTFYPEKERKLKVAQKTHYKINQSRKKSKLARLRNFAAAIVAMLLISSGIIWTMDNEEPELLIVSSDSGEIKNFTLEDGTSVWLNAQSSLSYPKQFSKKNRTVILEGEAYFDVTSNKKHPFIVKTKQIEVNVTGTRFNVSAYKNDPLVSTYLEEGSVSVLNKESNNNYDITPGRVLELNKESKDISINKANTKYLTSWKNGELSFYNEGFESIARKLERKFGIEVIIENESIKHLKYTADFDKEGIEEILDILNGARTMEVKVIEQKYYISEKES